MHKVTAAGAEIQGSVNLGWTSRSSRHKIANPKTEHTLRDREATGARHGHKGFIAIGPGISNNCVD